GQTEVFDKEIKEVEGLFDSVIHPINKQVQEFTKKQREEKEKLVKNIIEETVKEAGLKEEYASKVEVLDEHLSQSATVKRIRENVEFRVNNLKMEQEKEESDKQVISSTVELANERYNVNLTVEPYTRLLEFDDVTDIKKQILDHAKNEAEKQELRKRLDEHYEKSLEEMPDIDELEKVNVSDDLPFGNIGGDKEIDVTLTLTLTNDQLDELERYLAISGIEHWEVIE